MKKKLATLFTIMAVVLFSAACQVNKDKNPFAPLSYKYSALEPYIDSTTMMIHYERHYAAYYNNFLKAVAGTDMDNKAVEEVLAAISTQPAAVRNNAGGYYNHRLFWENLNPITGAPSDKLKGDIEIAFGSFDEFKKEFTKTAAAVFGSGWAWLIINSNNELQIISTPNQDNPLMDIAAVKGIPLLALDVWEHAYYLKYQNKRADYLDAFWSVVNWNCVNERYSKAKK